MALLSAACAEGETPAGAERPPVVVQVVEVEPRVLPETVAAVGSLETPQPTTVAAEVPGKVAALDVPQGERVEQDHVLARIDDEPYRAAVQVAEARHENARKRLARMRTLREEGVASQEALDDALAAFDAAAGQLAEARSDLDDTVVRAPFPGIVGLRRTSLGEYLRPGDPVVDITLDTGLEVRFFVPQSEAPRIAAGQPLHGRVGPCGPRFEGQVTARDARLDPSSRTLAVEGLVADPGDGLAPGMGVRLRVLVGERPDALVVPREAVVGQGTQQLVFVLDADDRAQPREVALGEHFPDGVQVTAGLAPGDRVVAGGQQKLRPGAPTEPVPWTPTENPNLELGRFGPAEACEVLRR